MANTTSSTPTKSPAGAGSEIPPPAGDAAPPPAAKPDRVTAVSNLALGSLLMAIDVLDDWVDHNVPTQAQALEQRAKGAGGPAAPVRMGGDIRPAGDRSRAACRDGHWPLLPTRGPCGRRGSSCGPADVAVDAASWPLDHIFLFRPLRYGKDRVAEAANQQIDRWVEAGRALDTGSRAVAEVSLGRAAQDSVDIVTVEPHVQVLIQEIVAAQGTSITKELIEEVREHSVVAGYARG